MFKLYIVATFSSSFVHGYWSSFNSVVGLHAVPIVIAKDYHEILTILLPHVSQVCMV